jgi:hypothetical protein
MADLQTDGARVLSLWRNEGVSSYRKGPRNPGQLAKLVIDIDSGEDREAPTSVKALRPIRPKPSAASKSRRATTKRTSSRRSRPRRRGAPNRSHPVGVQAPSVEFYRTPMRANQALKLLAMMPVVECPSAQRGDRDQGYEKQGSFRRHRCSA